MRQAMPFLLGVLLCMSFMSSDNKTVINAQFERLQGNWEGFMEYTDFTDDKTRYTMPAKCSTKYDGKKWTYDVLYDEGDGEVVGGGGECTINDDGSKIDYNGIVWDVSEVIEMGDTVQIVMSTKGKDNRKKASLRQTLEVTSTTFSITEEVKYDTSTSYFIRNRHLFRRSK
jgi:hypothetical protein